MSTHIDLSKGLYTHQQSCLHVSLGQKAKIKKEQRTKDKGRKRRGRAAQQRVCEKGGYSKKDCCLCLMRDSLTVQISGSLHSAGEPFNYTFRSLADWSPPATMLASLYRAEMGFRNLTSGGRVAFKVLIGNHLQPCWTSFNSTQPCAHQQCLL